MTSMFSSIHIKFHEPLIAPSPMYNLICFAYWFILSPGTGRCYEFVVLQQFEEDTSLYKHDEFQKYCKALKDNLCSNILVGNIGVIWWNFRDSGP
jgi:hypothetical protein